MKTITQTHGLRRSVLALALLAAFGPVLAEDDVAHYIKPDSTATIGLAGASGNAADRAIFGQYNGMRERSVYELFGLDYISRDDATGTWLMIKAANLGLDTRELSLLYAKQGHWQYLAEYEEISRVSPRTINTGMTGVGTPNPVVSRLATPGGGANVDLETKRKRTGLGFEKWLLPSLQFEASVKNEEKSGARLWGIGYDCASYICGTSSTTQMNQTNFVKNALLMLPEPVSASTRQMDTRLNYHTSKLLLSAGYSGSFYRNDYGSIKAVVPNLFNTGLGVAQPGYPAVGNNIISGGGTSLQNVLQLPVALPPDNQAHQVYLTGSYALAPKTKANFKYAYSRATQNDSFAGMGLTGAPAGVGSLNAKVVSHLAQVGLSSRPFAPLSLTANLRYEDKKDKTPSALYNLVPLAVVPATTPGSVTRVGGFWNNNKVSMSRLGAKLEASYRLASAWRATLGADYNALERNVPTSIAEEKVGGVGPLRAKNNETGWRAELQRSMSDKLNGSLSYSSSRRSGSEWTSLSLLNPATPGTSASNLALINTYCGGAACYGQQMPAESILGLSANTPFPVSLTDVERNKWKLSGDWTPTDSVNVQLVLEEGRDRNMAPFNPVAGGKGWRDTGVSLYSLDVGYAMSETWKLTAYASHGDQTLKVNHSTGYMADLINRNDSAGLGLAGKFGSAIDVGATLSYVKDVNRYGLAANTGTSGILPAPLTVVAPSAANLAQVAIGLPDATFSQVGLKVFGTYALNKHADLRMDLVHQRVRLVEWTWGYNGVPFVYADNTTVHMQERQRVTLLGMSYVYKF